MRPLLLAFAASSLALAGCGKKQAETNSSASDESLSSDEPSTNDTTSIDAATGAAANMAADADINQPDNNSGDVALPADRKPARPRIAAPVTANTTSNLTAEPALPATPPANSTAG